MAIDFRKLSELSYLSGQHLHLRSGSRSNHNLLHWSEYLNKFLRRSATIHSMCMAIDFHISFELLYLLGLMLHSESRLRSNHSLLPWSEYLNKFLRRSVRGHSN